MRTLQKNEQLMFYANQTEKVPIYELDEDGNIVYIEVDDVMVPVETGDYEYRYGNVKELYGNIAMSGGESDEEEYGISKSEYDAVLVLDKNAADISETTLIWFESPVSYEDTGKTIIDAYSADYKVLAPKPSLNSAKYILGKVTK